MTLDRRLAAPAAPVSPPPASASSKITNGSLRGRARPRVAACALLAAALLGGVEVARAQSVVPVGAGSYASYPPASEGVDAFVNTQTIYTSPGESRPIPTNDWWTDLLISQYSGALWAYPLMVDTESFGFNLHYPKEFNAGGNDMLLGPAVRVGGVGFAPTKAFAKDWSDSTVIASLPDGARNMDVTLAHGIPMVWVQTTGFNPEIKFSDSAQFLTASGAPVTFPVSSGALAIQTGGRLFGLHLADGVQVTADGSQYATIDLGSTQSISRVKLTWEAAYAKGYRIQVSGNGTTWTDVATVTSGDGGTDDLNVAGSGRYVRILLLEKGTNWAYSLFEMQVYNGATLLSQGRPVNVSSTEGGFVAQNLVDGNLGTRWAAGANAEQKLTINVGSGNTFFTLSALTSLADLNTFQTYAYNRPTSTQVGYQYRPVDGKVDVTWSVATQNLKTGASGGDVIQGFIPHHYKNTTRNFNFGSQQYVTSRGWLKTAIGKQFSITYTMNGVLPNYTAPYVKSTDATPYNPAIQYDLVSAFASKTGYGADTYWGGKDLVNFAKYTLIAKELNHQAYNALKTRTREALVNWLTYTPGETSKYFAYYPRWKALVGFDSSYGSEQFTDNHFHYGYLIHAAALYGMVDPDFLAQYGDILKMVAKQYAGWVRNDPQFPYFRTLDPWIGHSYAGGTSSATGNNQESTSEAMQSWIGLFLLGNALGDSAMRDAGAFGYASESAATLEYWFDWSYENLAANYPHSMVGILWPGGYSYGTFFSASPVHIHGIQYLPVAPGFNYLARSKTWAAQEYQAMMQESQAVEGFTDEAQFGADWAHVALGFRQLFDAPYVAQKMQAYWNADNGVMDYEVAGMTYYYTHANQNLGDVAWDLHTNLPASTVYYKPSTGQITAVAYNPTASPQTCTIYNASGAVVRSFTVPARSIVSNPADPTAGQPPAAGYRLAVAAASASSGTAGAALDNNGGSRWESAFADPQWLMLDMGSAVQPTQIVIDWEVANAKNYQIQGSSDGVNWTTLISKTNMPTGNRTDNLTGFPATAYRYLRVYGTQRNTAWGYSIFEIAVYGKMPAGSVASFASFEDADAEAACVDESLGYGAGDVDNAFAEDLQSCESAALEEDRDDAAE